MRERKNRRCLGADERFPAFAHEVRARAQFTERPHPGERGPRGRGIGIEEIQRVCHSFCTRALSLSGRPVGITSVCPLARTITMSSMPTSAMSSVSAQITERKSTRLNSSHVRISYAVFCLKKKKQDSCQRSLIHRC